jgi:hypothetical protein
MIGKIWRALMATSTPRGWALILAGPLITLLVIYFSLIVWLPPQLPALAHMQLEFLGWALEGSLLLLGIVVAALASARVSGSGPAGIHFDVDASDKTQAITTTTKTEVHNV